MKIKNFGAPHTNISIVPGVGVRATLYGANMSVCGNWSYDTGLGWACDLDIYINTIYALALLLLRYRLGGEGHFLVDITGIDLALTLTIGKKFLNFVKVLVLY